MMGVQQQICWVLYFIIRNMITVYFTSMGTQQRNSQLSFTKITIIVLAVFTLSEIIQATNLSVSTKADVTKSRHLREYIQIKDKSRNLEPFLHTAFWPTNLHHQFKQNGAAVIQLKDNLLTTIKNKLTMQLSPNYHLKPLTAICKLQISCAFNITLFSPINMCSLATIHFIKVTSCFYIYSIHYRCQRE